MKTPQWHFCLFIVMFMVCGSLLTSCGKNNALPEEPEKKEKLNTKLANAPSYCAGLPNPCLDPACKPYFDCEEHVGEYAGRTIVYEAYSGCLRFNSLSDFQAVLDALNSAYEAHNDNYEALYPTLTADQLDDMDSITGFDEFAPLRDFEAGFSGIIFPSKRAEIEETEEAWLLAGMTGIDPTDADLSFDVVENTLMGPNNTIKIGATAHELTAGPAVEAQFAVSPLADDCETNKRHVKTYTSSDGKRKVKLKAAINSTWLRSSVKGKVVAYANKRGRWRRARMDIRVIIAGTTYTNQCAYLDVFNLPRPVNGYKRKKELKVVHRGYAAWWKKKPLGMSAAFELSDLNSESITF